MRATVDRAGLDSESRTPHIKIRRVRKGDLSKVRDVIEQAPDKYQQELESLLTLKFQTFKAVRVLGEASNICLFPVAKKAQKKVSSKAA